MSSEWRKDTNNSNNRLIAPKLLSFLGPLSIHGRSVLVATVSQIVGPRPQLFLSTTQPLLIPLYFYFFLLSSYFDTGCAKRTIAVECHVPLNHNARALSVSYLSCVLSSRTRVRYHFDATEAAMLLTTIFGTLTSCSAIDVDGFFVSAAISSEDLSLSLAEPVLLCERRYCRDIPCLHRLFSGYACCLVPLCGRSLIVHGSTPLGTRLAALFGGCFSVHPNAKGAFPSAPPGLTGSMWVDPQ